MLVTVTEMYSNIINSALEAKADAEQSVIGAEVKWSLMLWRVCELTYSALRWLV